MKNKHRTDTLWFALQSTPEGRILILGLGLALLGIVGLAVIWEWSPDMAQLLVGLTATNIFFGRAAGLTFGYASGLTHAVALPINMYIETLLVLLFYPLFVFTLQHLVSWPALQSLVNRVQAAALKREQTVERFGILGLFLFVFFPYWMTGPVMGCALGYLIGLRPWRNIFVVLSGTYAAIVSWGFFLEKIHSRLAAYSVVAPFFLFGVIVLLIVAARLRKKYLMSPDVGANGSRGKGAQ